MQTKEAISAVEHSGRSWFIFLFNPVLDNHGQCSLPPRLALGPPCLALGPPRLTLGPPRLALGTPRAEMPVQMALFGSAPVVLLLCGAPSGRYTVLA